MQKYLDDRYLFFFFTTSDRPGQPGPPKKEPRFGFKVKSALHQRCTWLLGCSWTNSGSGVKTVCPQE